MLDTPHDGPPPLAATVGGMAARSLGHPLDPGTPLPATVGAKRTGGVGLGERLTIDRARLVRPPRQPPSQLGFDRQALIEALLGLDVGLHTRRLRMGLGPRISFFKARQLFLGETVQFRLVELASIAQ